MKAAMINNIGAVIGEVFDAPEKGNEIEVAGAFTTDGSPVNVKTYKISRSKRNLEKARYSQTVIPSHGVWKFADIDNEEECR